MVVSLSLLLSSCENNNMDYSPMTGDPIEAVIPDEFKEYAVDIESSKRKYIRIQATPKKNTALIASKFLGKPFFRKDDIYPLDTDGKPLVLLAQINFSEVPPLEGFPDKGILQFFIQGEMGKEHVWGMNRYDKKPWDANEYFQDLKEQKYFRIIYHPVVEYDKLLMMTKFPSNLNDGLPIIDECRLSFQIDEEYISSDDYIFEKYFGYSIYDFNDKHADLDWEKFKELYQYLGSKAIAKIGGYGRFVQGDPRHVAPKSEDWLVLLNIESSSFDEKAEILWGDAGVGSFLITRKDLEIKNFSNVVYYWDNH